jgi:hypothetical protein
MCACAVGTLLTTTPAAHQVQMYVAGVDGFEFGQKLSPGSKQRCSAGVSDSVQAPVSGRSLAVSQPTCTLPVVVPTVLDR